VEPSVTLPPDHELRAPGPDEVGAIARLNAVCDAAVGSAPSLTEDLLRRMWGRPRFDLATDAWVVEHARSPVAFAQVWEEDPTHLSAFAIVHPDHAGRGIGTALATLIERRATERASGDAHLFSAVLTQDEVGARLLETRGYAWARRFWHMEIELEGEQPLSEPPAGIQLRPLEMANDLPAVYRILDEAFRDHWGYAPSTFEEFLEVVHGEDYEPSLWVLAVDDGRPVGVLWGSEHSDRGWVGEVGVLRSHRRRGLATAMLRESFAEFERRGLRRVRLNVDSDNVTGAVSIYERIGMRVVSSYDLWSLPVADAAG
jgi:mycothiol synthase